MHHLKPLALLQGKRELNPVADLRPVCPNCHPSTVREVLVWLQNNVNAGYVAPSNVDFFVVPSDKAVPACRVITLGEELTQYRYQIAAQQVSEGVLEVRVYAFEACFFFVCTSQEDCDDAAVAMKSVLPPGNHWFGYVRRDVGLVFRKTVTLP